MLRDYFLNKIENAIELAIKEGKLGQMSEYTKGSLIVEKPKNTEFKFVNKITIKTTRQLCKK